MFVLAIGLLFSVCFSLVLECFVVADFVVLLVCIGWRFDCSLFGCYVVLIVLYCIDFCLCCFSDLCTGLFDVVAFGLVLWLGCLWMYCLFG